MGTKLSVKTGARSLSLRLLAITAALVAGFAITASGASAATTPGSWTVRPGQSLLLTDLIISARSVVNGPFDIDTAYICVDGTCDVQHPILSNALSVDGETDLASFSYANPAHTMTHTVTLDLHDFTNVCDTFSDGGFPGAFVTTFPHSRFVELRDGNLPEGGCGRTSGNADFVANWRVRPTP
jgi:hypothetical protein